MSTDILQYCTVIWTLGYFALKNNLFNQSASRVML